MYVHHTIIEGQLNNCLRALIQEDIVDSLGLKEVAEEFASNFTIVLCYYMKYISIKNIQKLAN